MKRVICTIWLLVAAMTMRAETETTRVMLSGAGFGDEVEWDFFCSAGARSGSWQKIAVPSQWELQGFGEYTYGRWYKEKGAKPSTEVGTYRRSFAAPEAWRGQRVQVVFEGVMTDATVLVNGKLAGETHRGGFYRFSYDISDKLRFGAENIIEVKVEKHSANASVNAAERRADWWLFGGIYRPVYLEVFPPASIDRVAADARRDGSISIRTTLRGARAGERLRATIRPLIGNEGAFDTAVVVLGRGQERGATIEHAWRGVKAWNPEEPNLYVLCLRLEDERGRVLHQRSERVGFRTAEFRRGDGIYVNGVKIVMKGINRHSFWPDGGRCTNREISVKDVALIKEMNANAVRSHYPPDTHFLDACDSLGLFVIDELAGWQNAYDTRAGALLQREMVERDVNHPSVIIWSNGNEGGWNVALDAGFAEHDPQHRHVIHPWADFDGIDTHHYPAFLTGVGRLANGYDVFMPTEFMHGCYDQGHGAGLEDFWTRYKQHPLFAGAFTWDFSDNAVKRVDRADSLDSAGELAADGILGPYREKEGSYYTVREVWAPVQFAPLYITPSFDGSFIITNEYLYTNLSRCTARFRLSRVDAPWQGGGQREVGAGEVSLPSLAPGERGRLRVPLAGLFDADVLELTVTDPHGKEMCTWSWPVTYAREYAARHLPATRGNVPARYREEGNRLILSAAKMEVVFDKETGMMVGVTRDGRSLSFGNGPVPVGMNAIFKNFKARLERGDALFTARYAGAIDSIQWRLTPDGLLRMSAVMLNRASGGEGFDAALTEEDISNFGFSFDFPEERVTGMTWLGRGPYRVWKNRVKGARHGRWTKGYNNTITGVSFENLVYPEFKGYHANLYWATVESNEGDFTVMSESDGLFFRVFTPAQPEGVSRDRALPPFPPGDISFLYDIPGMRCFKPLSQHGPSAQPGSIRVKKGDEGLSMTLWFDFTGDASNAPRWPEAKVEARPWTRWWWLGSAVDSLNLTRNLEEYARAGLGGVEITPIYGVQGNEARDIPFLSPAWMNVLQHTLAEGKRVGMEVEMNAGTGWPYGGPEVTIEDAATRVLFRQFTLTGGQRLEERVVATEKNQERVARVSRVMAFPETGKCLDITDRCNDDGQLDWVAPPGAWRVIALLTGKTLQMVKRAAPGGEGYVMDHLSARAVRNYLDRFDRAFASSGAPYPHAFFNDSYEVYGSDWTPDMLEQFRDRRGYKLEEYLPEFLGEGDKELRARVIADYRETMAELLLENFTRQWTAWAHRHGSITRNQAHGSPGNLIDLYAAVDIPECESFGISDFHVQGLRRDSLFKKNDSDLSMLKYASSAAHVTGKPLTSSETFTWLTEHFRTSLAQCKPDLDLMFVAGVNHLFFHGTPYSPREAEWPGWLFYASINMSPTNTIWRDAPALFRYIERCQSFLQMGQPDNDFLVYLPVYDLWHEQGGRMLPFSIHDMARRAPKFIEAVHRINESGHDADYISDNYILSSTVERGLIKTAGGAAYKALVVPGVSLMPLPVLEHLTKLVKQGAKVVFIEKYPRDVPGLSRLEERRVAFNKLLAALPAVSFDDARATPLGKGLVITGKEYAPTLEACGVPAEELKSRWGIQAIRRANETGHHYFISSLQASEIDAWIPLAVPAAGVIIYDPMTGKAGAAKVRAEGGRAYIHLQLKSGASLILRTYTGEMPPAAPWAYHEEAGEGTVINGDWTIRFLDSHPAIPGVFRVGRARPWTELPHPAATVNSGTAVYATRFTLPRQRADDWRLSLGKVYESARVRVNGREAGTAWALPMTIDIGHLLREGENLLEIEVTNLPANRVADYDRRGIPWRVFKEINIVDLSYKKTTYGHWGVLPAGLGGDVRLIPLKRSE
ncbi:MAG: hypothetical protein LBI96_02415 [Odoribacteraceae bacterium]|jgi:hypothetical protein|nr:hypothetical protein [Odoribacteraceae bacterium]